MNNLWNNVTHFFMTDEYLCNKVAHFAFDIKIRSHTLLMKTTLCNKFTNFNYDMNECVSMFVCAYLCTCVCVCMCVCKCMCVCSFVYVFLVLSVESSCTYNHNLLIRHITVDSRLLGMKSRSIFYDAIYFNAVYFL